MTPADEALKHARDRIADCERGHLTQPCHDPDCIVSRAYIALSAPPPAARAGATRAVEARKWTFDGEFVWRVGDELFNDGAVLTEEHNRLVDAYLAAPEALPGQSAEGMTDLELAVLLESMALKSPDHKRLRDTAKRLRLREVP